MKSEVWDQDGHEGNYYNLHRETGLTMTIPGGDRLQDTGTNESKRNCVGAYHPLAVLLYVPITSGKKSCGCSDKPSPGLNCSRNNEVNRVRVMAMV